MKVHKLKTDSEAFDAIWSGVKLAEFRFNDRGFKVGDRLALLRQDTLGVLTGQSITCWVVHIQTGYGIPEGYVMMSFRVTSKLFS